MKVAAIAIVLVVAIVSLTGCSSKGVPVDQDPRMTLPAVEKFVPNQTNQNRITIILGVMILCGLVYGIRYWSKTDNPAIVCMIVGASLNTLIEPFCDHMAALLFFRGDYIVLEFFGRPMPLWLTLLYSASYGSFGLLIYLKLIKGATRKEFWVMFACMAAVAILFELVLTNIDGLYDYYGGHQPLEFMEYPFWMLGINGLGIMFTASMFYLLTPHLKGWRWLITLPLVPITTMMFAYSACAYPAYIAINSQFPAIVVHLLGILSIAMSSAMIWILTLFVCKDSPYDLLCRRIAG
jgi:hypothetical protein